MWAGVFVIFILQSRQCGGWLPYCCTLSYCSVSYHRKFYTYLAKKANSWVEHVFAWRVFMASVENKGQRRKYLSNSSTKTIRIIYLLFIHLLVCRGRTAVKGPFKIYTAWRALFVGSLSEHFSMLHCHVSQAKYFRCSLLSIAGQALSSLALPLEKHCYTWFKFAYLVFMSVKYKDR